MPVMMPVLLVAAANALVGAADGRVDDTLIEQALREVRFAPDRVLDLGEPVRRPFDTALVHYLGYWSHFDARYRESSWPLPATGECTELARFGREHRLLVEEPEPGDVFLLWGVARRSWLRAGIVMSALPCAEIRGAPAFLCQTVEGDTNQHLRSGGGKVLRHQRRLSYARGDRFLRWDACDGLTNSRLEVRRQGAYRASMNGVLPRQSAGLAVAA